MTVFSITTVGVFFGTDLVMACILVEHNFVVLNVVIFICYLALDIWYWKRWHDHMIMQVFWYLVFQTLYLVFSIQYLLFDILYLVFVMHAYVYSGWTW